MWPFRHKGKHSHELPEEFLQRLERVESSLKLVQTEWNEVYDKIAHAFDRERKRRRVAFDASAAEIAEQTAPGAQKTPDWSDPVVILSEARKRGM